MNKSLPVLFFLFAYLACHAQYTFVFLHKKPDAEKLSEERSKEIMAGHFANMERLGKEKKLLAAGPFEGGGGIFILNTTNIDSAKFWISPDTGIKANRWNVEMLPYSPFVGNLCAVSAPYNMVTYSFVRFTEAPGKKISRGVAKQHKTFLTDLSKSGQVVTAGLFSELGGILILNGEFSDDMVAADPAMKQSLLTYELKKLYIAKGSFCEK